MKHHNVAVAKVQGALKITPELTWDQFKKTEYVSWELVQLQGRNSHESGSLEFEIKDRLVDDKLGVFGKYVDTVRVKETWNLTLAGLTRQIDKLLEKYPKHEFNGVFYVDSTDVTHQYRIVVKDGKVMVLTRMQIWRVDGIDPPRHIKSRWDGANGWVDDDVWDRLKRANELIRLLNDQRKPQEIMQSHFTDDHECDSHCLVYQVADHLLGESKTDDDDGWAS